MQSRREFLLASLFAILARAQDEATYRTEVKVVDVLATVRTKQGRIVRDLGRDDFLLLENRRPQIIRYFSRETDLPLTLGLMVDTSMSQRKVLSAERAACFHFLDAVLRETKDQVFIMQFDMAVRVAQELTSSRSALDDALSYVDTPSRRELSMQSGGGTLLYDAVLKASHDTRAHQKNRKALIVMSDGVDFGSTATADEAIEAALRADALIYSILFSDAGAYGLSLLGGRGRKVLARMAAETGGGFFEVSKKQTIDDVFAVIQDELRSEYNIGFISDQPVEISEFRKLELLPKATGLVVQARDRYWARR
ncbi:MAG TPA: VWA domain-containing protein [Bryobacteraceae bacterium]|nr:VWA domain-containing protein [Bryobacteraceae bacterium]